MTDNDDDKFYTTKQLLDRIIHVIKKGKNMKLNKIKRECMEQDLNSYVMDIFNVVLIESTYKLMPIHDRNNIPVEIPPIDIENK